jgi:hypothetical protein
MSSLLCFDSANCLLELFEKLTIVGTVIVVIGLIKEYGIETFKPWERDKAAHIKVETAPERLGGALVVLGIVLELAGSVGVLKMSRSIET